MLVVFSIVNDVSGKANKNCKKKVAVWFQDDRNQEKQERANLAAISHNQKVNTRDIFNSLGKNLPSA